jgi:uncharacterized membrane protein
MTKYFMILTALVVTFIGYRVYRLKSTPVSSPSSINVEELSSKFFGEKGETLTLVDGKLSIPTSGFETNKVRYFNTTLNGKTIYFIVVRDNAGTYRAAANACEACFKGRLGFVQEGEEIICNNCKNRFALNTLGVVKGGCNPGPINANIPVTGGQLTLTSSELFQVINLF